MIIMLHLVLIDLLFKTYQKNLIKYFVPKIIFFYLMVLCMIGIDYTSYYNGVITGSNKAIIKFMEEINKRENKLEEIESREVNCK